MAARLSVLLAPLAVCAEAVAGLTGWRRIAACALVGALGALAMPPFSLWPVLALSFCFAIWSIDGVVRRAKISHRAPFRACFVTGWLFGFGYFVAGLWWLGAAFLVEAERFAWLMPLGVIGLPAGLAVFPALGFALCGSFWASGSRRIFAFAGIMAALEWLRGQVFTGFPWNAYGMAFGAAPPFDQAAALIGLEGLTWCVLFTLAAPAVLADTEGRRWALPAACACLLIVMAVFGYWRVPAEPMPVHPGITLRLMQPNIPQDARFRPDARDDVLARYIALSGAATRDLPGGIGDVTHLIWPESAFPFILDREPEAMRRLAAFLPDRTILVTGAARAEAPLPGERQFRIFNSIQVFDGEGRFRDTYDKVYLVPFGEYLPFQTWIAWIGLRQLVNIPGGFTAGLERKLLSVPGMPPVVALICYEAIFPGAAVVGQERPGLLLNVTNDAWFGLTPGPHQHYAQARLRAIEQGLPLIRAANNGISAVVDPFGRPLVLLPSGAEGIVDSKLPIALVHTIYARLHSLAFIVLVVISLLRGVRIARILSATSSTSHRSI